MTLFLLSLAYRIFRSPFAAWVLLSMTLVSILAALGKVLLALAFPVLLGPNALRGIFQLAFYAFLPIALLMTLTQYRWPELRQERHPLYRWPTAWCLLALTLWMLLLLGLFGFNVLYFPR